MDFYSDFTKNINSFCELDVFKALIWIIFFISAAFIILLVSASNL